MNTQDVRAPRLHQDVLATFVATACAWLSGVLIVMVLYPLEFDPLDFGLPWAGLFAGIGWLVLVLPLTLILRRLGWMPTSRGGAALGAILGALVFLGVYFLFFRTTGSSATAYAPSFVEIISNPSLRWMAAWAVIGGAVAGALLPRLRALSTRRLLGIAALPAAALTWVVGTMLTVF